MRLLDYMAVGAMVALLTLLVPCATAEEEVPEAEAVEPDAPAAVTNNITGTVNCLMGEGEVPVKATLVTSDKLVFTIAMDEQGKGLAEKLNGEEAEVTAEFIVQKFHKNDSEKPRRGAIVGTVEVVRDEVTNEITAVNLSVSENMTLRLTLNREALKLGEDMEGSEAVVFGELKVASYKEAPSRMKEIETETDIELKDEM